jgi:hypothetical protein
MKDVGVEVKIEKVKLSKRLTNPPEVAVMSLLGSSAQQVPGIPEQG